METFERYLFRPVRGRTKDSRPIMQLLCLSSRIFDLRKHCGRDQRSRDTQTLIKRTKTDTHSLHRHLKVSETQIKSLGQSVKIDVRKIKEKSKGHKKRLPTDAKEIKQEDRKSIDKTTPTRTHRLGRQHCPAWGARCSSCEKDNHFAKCCKSTQRNSTYGVREEFGENSRYADNAHEESSSELHRLRKRSP